jgi:hypothetical protein
LATLTLPTGVTDAPVPQQKASEAPLRSARVKRFSKTAHPHSFSANSMIDDLVTPGRMVPGASDGVTIVLLGYTAKKLDAPASSIASPLFVC